MDFIKSLLLDCGRKYFSLSEIKTIVDEMADNGFNTLILAFGNDGFRFFLDDMKITVGENEYSSDLVKEKFHLANISYYDAGAKNELNQTEMEELISYSNEKNIDIIPLLNSPGHMNAILSCMELLGFRNIRYKNSKSTIDLDNKPAVEFLNELLKKYINWFYSKGCIYFHLGCDEYANDILPSGFADLQLPENNKYGCFIAYVNTLADIVLKKGMTPLIFNDGMYIGNTSSKDKINSDVICSYWTKGWEGYRLADAQKIIDNKHYLLNTNSNWYYVLGRYTKETSHLDFTLDKALAGMQKIKQDDISGCGKHETIGITFCIWCDTPSVQFDEIEKNNIATLIKCFGKNVITNDSVV